MASCEKCWKDAGGNSEQYFRLLENREDHKCTPEQQAGELANKCVVCGRLTMHQYANVCMNQECPGAERETG